MKFATTFEVLSEKEMEMLLCVPTSVKEAKQIHNRNSILLKQLEVGEEEDILESYDDWLGCPHCDYVSKPHCDYVSNWDVRLAGFQCKNCAWLLYPIVAGKPCCCAMFGGVSLLSQGCDVDLGHNTASIRFSEDGDFEMTYRFLTGHIEWAEEVIARGGNGDGALYRESVGQKGWPPKQEEETCQDK